MGGYLINNTWGIMKYQFTKENNGFRETYTRMGCETYKNNIPYYYERAINRMQRVPYKINKEVYEILKENFQNDYRHPIWELKFRRGIDLNDKVKRIEEKLTENGRKQHFLINLILSGAELHNNLENYIEGKFYIPQMIEKRGRAYAQTSIINFYNSALVRSLILFYNGEELVNKENLKELIAIGSGFYEKRYEKESLEEKLKWWEENENEFLVYFPKERKWQIKPDKWKLAKNSPFEFLAWLLEMKNYKNSNENFKYKTHFPIGKDCTSSAFQIYSLILNDKDIGNI
jgi:DNA-directed RNA polymerase